MITLIAVLFAASAAHSAELACNPYSSRLAPDLSTLFTSLIEKSAPSQVAYDSGPNYQFHIPDRVVASGKITPDEVDGLCRWLPEAFLDDMRDNVPSNTEFKAVTFAERYGKLEYALVFGFDDGNVRRHRWSIDNFRTVYWYSLISHFDKDGRVNGIEQGDNMILFPGDRR